MIRSISSGRNAFVLALAVLAAACSSGERPRSAASVATPADRGEIEAIAALLDQGDRAKAKKRVVAGLKRSPGDASLMLLRDSIERTPEELLGPANFPYTARPGETMAEIAQRFLGNRLKSYQLARYNAIERPAALTAGTVLRIPGQQRAEPRSEPAKRPERRADPQPQASRPKPAVATPAPAPARAPANSAAARQARSAGLAALNEGNPARAVALLSRAAALEPGNPAIARDLQRARRVNATVQARQ